MKLSVLGALTLVAAGCSGDDRCGPSSGVVMRAVDGDTVELEDGHKVRYLMVDTPESTNGATDCYGSNAHDYNAMLVEGKEVQLEYDVECEDRYGRLLAYVSVGGTEINSLLVERGYACVLHIPPNGADRVDEFQALEDAAKAENRGMWGACEVVTCE